MIAARSRALESSYYGEGVRPIGHRTAGDDAARREVHHHDGGRAGVRRPENHEREIAHGREGERRGGASPVLNGLRPAVAAPNAQRAAVDPHRITRAEDSAP